MQLRKNTTPAKAERTLYSGQADSIEITSGQTLKIESSPGGEEILDVKVPEGKRWVTTIQVAIQEFDI